MSLWTSKNSARSSTQSWFRHCPRGNATAAGIRRQTTGWMGAGELTCHPRHATRTRRSWTRPTGTGARPHLLLLGPVSSRRWSALGATNQQTRNIPPPRFRAREGRKLRVAPALIGPSSRSGGASVRVRSRLGSAVQSLDRSAGASRLVTEREGLHGVTALRWTV